MVLLSLHSRGFPLLLMIEHLYDSGMFELVPPPPPMVRRGQRLDAIRRREELISRLIAEQRLEVAALAREDLAGMQARYVADELALLCGRSPHA